MIPEPSSLLRYLIQEDIYLLPADREFYSRPASPVVDETPELVLKYLGDYKKEFLIITYYPEHEHMEPTHQAALVNTLQRLQLELEHVGILNKATHPEADFSVLIEKLNPQKLMILGTEAMPADAPSAMVLNELSQLNTAKALYTFSFNEMMGNKDKTKIFWNLIKQF